MIGKKFTDLTVVEEVAGGFLCRCVCGVERVFPGYELRRGNNKSCGCLKLRRFAELGRKKRTHGLTKTAEYRCWAAMKTRCTNRKTEAWNSHGGRGISICDRWNASFEDFLADMGPRPSPKHSIDRIDNDGNYTPENCRWATRTTQARNRRSNRIIEAGGERLLLCEWVRRTGTPKSTILNRIKRGWSESEAVLGR